jgi:hypothetical protein
VHHFDAMIVLVLGVMVFARPRRRLVAGPADSRGDGGAR